MKGLTMDSEYNLQDVVRCHVCEIPVPPLHCVTCNIHLCKDCEGKHISNKSKQHKIVPFKYRGSFPKCQKHSTKMSEHFCEECNIPICEVCVSSKEHQNHTVEEIYKGFESKNRLQNQLARDVDVDSEYSLQDVVRCHVCETPVPPLHCVTCNIHLCKDCERKHLSDISKEHNVVPFKYRGSFPKCQKHSTKMSEHFCEECNIPICELYVSCKEHQKHTVEEIYKGFESKNRLQNQLARDVDVTKCSKHSSKICERYCEKCGFPVCALCSSSKKHQAHDVVDIPKTLERKQTALMRDLQDLDKCIHPKYQEIASHTPAQKAGLNKTSKKLTASIHKYEQDFHREICIDIQNLKASRYEMDSKKKNKAQHSYQQIGLLSELAIKTKKHCYTMNFPGAETSSPNKRLINEPRIIKKINTKYKSYKLRSVSCQNDNIWTCGRDKVIRLFNLQGELVKSIQTEPVCNPLDIAVTRSGNLVYTDYMNKTVNIVKNTQIQTLIRLHGWKPRGVCSSSSWDLLVFMYSDDDKQTKVVCYSGSTEKKSIQYDDKGQPLYSSGSYYKYICENTNLDICVSDNGLRAVVVVNRAGKLRFTYTDPPTPTKESLRLVGIATDSLGRILTSDINNRCIHTLDQDGQFLRYIDNCDLRCPRGLCVDTRDNLFVTEYFTGRLKKIQYKT